MGSFRKVPLGYSPEEVNARIEELEREMAYISGMVVDRERELRIAREELAELRSHGEESLTAIATVSRQIEELQAQARGQATRIRMRALKEATDIGERITDLAKRAGLDPAMLNEFRRERLALEDALAPPEDAGQAGPASDAKAEDPRFDGHVLVEVGPLRDFSQLAKFEDAANAIGEAGEISVKGFSQGRATLAVQLTEPVDLLEELEERSPFGFSVRETARDRVVLDLDEPADEQAQAA